MQLPGPGVFGPPVMAVADLELDAAARERLG
jgi:hypothetical protein